MFCTLFIKTDWEVGMYLGNLKVFYPTENISDVFSLTSLSTENGLEKIYKSGYSTHSALYLFGEESAHTIRVFIECRDKKDNLFQLKNGTKKIVNELRDFYNSNNIKIKSLNLSIWSEGDEIINGELTDSFKDFEENIKSLPAGVFVTISTGLYTCFEDNEYNLSTHIKYVVIVGIGIILWLVYKLVFFKNELKFGIKS